MHTVATLHRRAKSRFNVADEMDKAVGSLDGITVKGQDVLLGVFLRPSSQYIVKPDGSFMVKADGTPMEILTAGTGKELVEDVYQGKVMRILKMGPQAFCPVTFPSLVDRWVEDKFVKGEWGSSTLPTVGDWVFCRANDGLQLSVQGPGSQRTEMFDGAEKLSGQGGWPCRIVAFNDIIGKVEDPYEVV